MAGDVEEIATKPIIGTKGQARPRSHWQAVQTTVEAAIWSVHVDVNDLDGGWLVTGEDGA